MLRLVFFFLITPGSLCKWDLDINLNATNQNTNPSQPVANKRDESLSQDKETIKNVSIFLS